jgi:hypothetical protein
MSNYSAEDSQGRATATAAQRRNEETTADERVEPSGDSRVDELAVTAAAELVTEAIGMLVTDINQRDTSLRGTWDSADADTEVLRTALRDARGDRSARLDARGLFGSDEPSAHDSSR